MPTRKISGDTDDQCGLQQCRHPDHNPPGHRVFTPGTYEHTCPKCGNVAVFVVRPRPSLSSQGGS